MKKINQIFSFLLCILTAAMFIPTIAQAATLTEITVKKTDANGNPLAEAVFTLTGTDNRKNYQAVSGENGLAKFTDVADGTYDLAEAMPPKGYAVSNEVYRISVNGGIVRRAVEPAGGTTGPEYIIYEMITFVNEKLPTYPVTIKKTDVNGNPLSGAVFKLTGTGNSIGQNYEAASGADGTAVLQVLEGWYKLEEVIAPDGYLPSNVTYDLVVSESGISTVKETDNGLEYTPIESITYINQAEPTYAFTVKKTDETGKPLAGAVFTLTGTGNSIGRNYEAVSDKNGMAAFNVREGYYTLAEKTAPEGYIKSDKTYEIAVWGGKVHFVKETDNDYSDYETVTYTNTKMKSSQTGDSAHMLLWFALLAGVSVVAGIAVCNKKRKAQ